MTPSTLLPHTVNCVGGGPSPMSTPESPCKTGLVHTADCVSMFDIHLRKILWVYCPGHFGVKGKDRADTETGGKNNHHRPGGLRLGRSQISVEELETLAGTKPRTSHHRSPGLGERRRTRKRSTVFLARTRKGRRRQSDQLIGTVPRTTLGKLSPERRGGAHMGLPERIDTILNLN